jgi:hypothetical protein
MLHLTIFHKKACVGINQVFIGDTGTGKIILVRLLILETETYANESRKLSEEMGLRGKMVKNGRIANLKSVSELL